MSGPIIAIEKITPTMAKDYLSANRANRTIRKYRVELYAHEMARGQWKMTGDPIRFDPDGLLLDGQHRLLAIIAYGRPVEMVVMRDIPSDSFKVIDSGLMRSYADALGTNVVNGASKAAICRLLYVFDLEGDPRKTEDMVIVSRPDVHDYYAEHGAEIDAAFRSASRLRSAIGPVNTSGWGATHVVAFRTDEEMAREFVEGVVTGQYLGAGDPRLALRNWMANQRTKTFANPGWYFALFIKAWNSYMNGETRQVLSIRPDEAFPKVVTKRKNRATIEPAK